MMRVYKWLLHLYPRSFRLEYGPEMCAILARRRSAASGRTGAASVWLGAAADVVVNALRVHWELLVQDVRYALRTLARARGFAATAVLVAALGIGATTAAFSMADHVLVRPLPFPESDRLVRLWQDQSFRGYPQMEQSPANYLDWKRLATSVESMSAYTSHAANLVGQGDPQRLQGATVTSDVFQTLRTQAALGRALTSVDDLDATQQVVVLSHGLWQAKFGGQSGVLGQTAVLNDVPHVIVGVMPPRFEFPSRDVEYWVPLRFSPPALKDRTDTYLNVVARLAPGVSLAQARSEMALVAAQLERAYPRENARTGATVHRLRDQVSSQARLLLTGLVGAAACMLLIACTNLANLLLARGVARRTELAVRAAIGAGRERLTRQTLTESLVLAVAGGVIGVLLAIAALPAISRLVPTSLPIPETPGVDLRMLGAAAVLILATGLGVGVLPALRMTRGSDADALRDGGRAGTGRTTERVRGALVIASVAASVVLLISSGLLVRALWRVQQVDPGFRSENVLALRTALPTTKYNTTARRQQFYDAVLDGIRSLPGVTGAAYISYLPMVMRGGIWPVILDPAGLSPEARSSWAPDPTETRMASFRLTTPGFFRTLGVPVLRGRDVSDADTYDAPWVAVVSQSFADQMWPGQDPLGREFFIAFRERTVVGVVGTIRVRGLERESEPQVYVPSRQVADNGLIGYAPKDLVVSASVPTTSLVPAIREVVARADAQQPISDVRLLSDIVNADTAPRRVQLAVLVGFAAVSFLLAGVGVHGLLAFAVSSRTREIGLRMALGARTGELVWMVIRRGLWLAAIGVALGLGLAVAAGQALQAVLAGVSPTDPVVYAAAVTLAVLMTLVGSLLPTLYAVRVDPIAAIRTE
jgi:putative ABC transport system permease protein